jgi:NAD-dependent protein deacetylase/lipoamidase
MSSEAIADRWPRARRILVITGAGVSAESGLPTFRGAGGWYRERRAEELATMAGFQRDPALVWEWYDLRRQQIGAAAPNDAHRTIADWQDHAEVVLVTQNVDDLHERAGSRDVIHVHGSIWKVKCMGGCGVWEDHRATLPQIPPPCPHCGALLRPDVVWFGEMLPTAALGLVDTQLRIPFDLAFVVGTEAVFGYIQEWALRARRAGALLVEVNPSETVLSDLVDVRLNGSAAAMLRSLPHR